MVVMIIRLQRGELLPGNIETVGLRLLPANLKKAALEGVSVNGNTRLGPGIGMEGGGQTVALATGRDEEGREVRLRQQLRLVTSRMCHTSVMQISQSPVLACCLVKPAGPPSLHGKTRYSQTHIYPRSHKQVYTPT